MLFGGITIPGKIDLDNVRKLDLLPIPFLRKANRIGMAVDREYFWDLGSRFRRQKLELEQEIESYIPVDRLHEFAARTKEAEEAEEDLDEDPDSTAAIERRARAGLGAGSAFNASSPEQIGRLLFDILNVGEGVELKRTKGTGRVSTGKKSLELIKLRHPVVPKVLRFRELDKLETTYANKLPRIAVFHPHEGFLHHPCPVCGLRHKYESWRVHGEFGTTRAETGRINHKNPNLGNVPSRSEDGQLVQAGFIAPLGCKLVVNDLSQIELRGLAHVANCSSMITTYEQDGDIHTETCYKTGLTPPDRKPTVAERMGAKRCIAAGQRVLTDKGLTPIERVRKHDLVWDGVEFVTHDGVLGNGVRQTLYYDGLCATADHEVWTSGGVCVTLAEAARARQPLMRTGDGLYTRAYNATSWSHYTMPGVVQEGGEVAVYDLLNAGTRHRYTVEDRLVVNCGFGIQNGTTKIGMFLQLVADFGAKGEPIPDWLTEDWCGWFIEQWLDHRFEVRKFFDLCHYRARRYGRSWEPFGRARLIPEVKSTHSWIREAGLRQAQNMPVTSMAAGQLKLGMGKVERLLDQLYQAGYWVWPLNSIHDAVMVEADEDIAEVVLDVMREALDTVMRDEETGEHCFRVPIKSDGGIHDRWEK